MEIDKMAKSGRTALILLLACTGLVLIALINPIAGNMMGKEI
jgi:hypothetical protein